MQEYQIRLFISVIAGLVTAYFLKPFIDSWIAKFNIQIPNWISWIIGGLFFIVIIFIIVKYLIK